MTKKFLTKVVPLWLVVVLIIDSVFLMGLAQYFLMKREITNAIQGLSNTTKDQKELVEILKQEVLPAKGYQTSLRWKDLGRLLVEAGAIDQSKFDQALVSIGGSKEEMKYLTGDWNDQIKIHEGNAHFLVNFFWALGLTNNSRVLDEGVMSKDPSQLANFASTGGWTLGQREAIKLYSSKEIIPLTDEQQKLVKKIADNVYRPCCGNATSFPDCNHGMAALGYIEWAVYNKMSEDQIYKDLLVLNSFWFPQNYVEMAIYFDQQGTRWNKVNPQLALSADYSSAQGARKIKQSIQNIPGLDNQGGSCGV